MVHVFHSRANVVVVRREKNLRLVLEAAVSLTVQNASVVALEFAADFIATTVKRIFAFYALFPFWRIFPARLLFKRKVNKKSGNCKGGNQLPPWRFVFTCLTVSIK